MEHVHKHYTLHLKNNLKTFINSVKLIRCHYFNYHEVLYDVHIIFHHKMLSFIKNITPLYLNFYLSFSVKKKN